jgi:hypothetical protein
MAATVGDWKWAAVGDWKWAAVFTRGLVEEKIRLEEIR